MSLIDVIFGDELSQYPHQTKPEPTTDRSYKIDPSMKVGMVVTNGGNKVAIYEDKPEPTSDRNYKIDPATHAGTVVTNGSNKPAVYEPKPESAGNTNYRIDPNTKVGDFVSNPQSTNGKVTPVSRGIKPGENDPSATNPFPQKTFLAESFLGYFRNAILTNDKYRLADRRFFLAYISPDDVGLFSEAILRDLSYLVQEVDLPTMAINDSQKSIDNELGAFRTPDLNSKLQANEQNFTVKFLDTEYSFIEEFFFSWMTMVMTPYKLSSKTSFPRATFYVDFFDNANKQMVLGYKLTGVYPTSITPPAASYGEGRGGITRSVSFHFNNVEITHAWASTQPDQLASAQAARNAQNQQKTAVDWRTSGAGQMKVSDNSVTSVLDKNGGGYNTPGNKVNINNGLAKGQTANNLPGGRISDLDTAKTGMPNKQGDAKRSSFISDNLSKFPAQMRAMTQAFPINIGGSKPSSPVRDQTDTSVSSPKTNRDATPIPNPRPITNKDNTPIGEIRPLNNRMNTIDNLGSSSIRPVSVRDHSTLNVAPRPVMNSSGNILLNSIAPVPEGVKADIDWNKHSP